MDTETYVVTESKHVIRGWIVSVHKTEADAIKHGTTYEPQCNLPLLQVCKWTGNRPPEPRDRVHTLAGDAWNDGAFTGKGYGLPA